MNDEEIKVEAGKLMPQLMRWFQGQFTERKISQIDGLKIMVVLMGSGTEAALIGLADAEAAEIKNADG